MRTVRGPLLSLGIAALLGWPSLVAATDAATIARQGNGRGALPCQSCHGADGAGLAAAGGPRLAGLDAAYLRKQLADFVGGSRENAVMQPVARALGDDERQALAVYYGSLPIPPAAAASVPPPAADGAGALLATRGRWAQRMPACEQCHGPGGVGVGAHFPPLAGQSAAYLEAQLTAWQRGTRRNDPLELMQRLSRTLDAREIAAVARWFAAQPLDRTRTKP